MKKHALLFAAVFAVASLTACQKARPIEKDPRISEVGHFNVNWPLKATTLESAIAEVEAGIGPGHKRADGMVEWTAQTDATHCARIQLKNEGGQLSATKEKLLERHPDFATCVAGK